MLYIYLYLYLYIPDTGLLNPCNFLGDTSIFGSNESATLGGFLDEGCSPEKPSRD